MRNLRSLWKATPKSSDLNFPNFPRRRLVPCGDGGLIIDEEKKPKKERQDALSEEGAVTMSRNKGLAEQDLSKLDVTVLHPLSPEVISRQATINIGTIGHVAHGKSTVVKAISGVQTVRFKNELERNITIKLGYANAKIYKCEDDKCPRPMCYKAYGSGKEDNPFCDVPGFENSKMKLLRHVSFVDCPGHDILMATMLNGAAIMDGALLLIAANESCPQPQTSEHLAAVEIMQLKHIIILQNKIDLIQENVAINQHEAIQKFIMVWKGQGSRKWKLGQNDGIFVQFESPSIRNVWFIPSSKEKGQTLCRDPQALDIGAHEILPRIFKEVSKSS
ncbi:hypothetical protein F2Q69_00058157 [Brassica cretica]|uniref:Tr-type G domain-containing protein n=1 Tax=Brassica cretica TaxID=69181 RepID=A0A8S9RR62_BRACR|nr:hypothetical protein F2Q69_00058157 [Brassica cretica]